MATVPVPSQRIRLTDAEPRMKTMVRNGIMQESSSTRAMDGVSRSGPSKSAGVNKSIRMGMGVAPRKGR